MSLVLASVDYIKSLNPALESDKRDPLYAALARAVSRQMERWLDVELDIVERTQLFSVYRGQTSFILKSFPVVIGEEFAVRNAYDGQFSTASDISSNNYYVDADRGRLLFRGAYYDLIDGPGVLQVRYTAGIIAAGGKVEETDFSDLALACAMQVLHEVQRNPNYGSSNRSVGGGGQYFDSDEKYESPFIPRVVTVLEQYRRAAGV